MGSAIAVITLKEPWLLPAPYLDWRRWN